MSAKLDVSDPEIQKALDDVRKGTNGINWVLFGYVPKTYKLKVEATGTDGLEGVKEELNEGKVLFAYVRYIIKNVPKFVYISWCGPTVTGMLRGSFNNHAIEMANFIKKGNPIHVQVNARTEEDVDDAQIRQRLITAVGSNYEAGAVKQGISEGVSSVKEGQKIHTEAQHQAAQTQVAGSKNVQYDKATSEQYWQSNKSQTTEQSKPQKTTPAIDASARQKFWAEQKAREEEEKKQQEQQKISRTTPTGTVKGRFSPTPTTPSPSSTSTLTPPKTEPKLTPPPVFSGSQSATTQLPPTAAPSAPKPQPAVTSSPSKVTAPPQSEIHPEEQHPEATTTQQHEYTNEEYGQEEYAQEEYGQEEYAATQQEEYGNEEYAQEEYVQEEYGQEEYAQEEYGQEEYAQEEYGQEEYAQEYIEGAQQEYANTETGGTQGVLRQVRALYDYAPQAEGDLEFKAGDVINVLDDSDPSGWWRGEVNGKEGVFPSNYVQNL